MHQVSQKLYDLEKNLFIKLSRSESISLRLSLSFLVQSDKLVSASESASGFSDTLRV